MVMEFGSDTQPLSMQLDTGSSDVWVATTACTECATWTDGNSNPVALFNSAASTSFQTVIDTPFSVA